MQIAPERRMEKKNDTLIQQYKHMDWAVLYMRVFAGGMMLFHNIGKIQNYNEIINSYPSWGFLSGPTVFVAVTTIEVVLATLLILGMWVRPSASIMALGFVIAMFWGASTFNELDFVWLGIYVFLIISGGGFYSFYAFGARNKQ